MGLLCSCTECNRIINLNFSMIFVIFILLSISFRDGEEKSSIQIYDRSDGSFVINGVPSGSYVVEVVHPVYEFRPVRVDILPTGKIRARIVNYMQASKVRLLPYPLVFTEWKKSKFFENRESMGPKDMLQHPMVLQLLVMVIPVLLVMMLPTLIPAHTLEEFQNQMRMMSPGNGRGGPSFDLAEWLTNFFSPRKRDADPRNKDANILDVSEPNGNPSGSQKRGTMSSEVSKPKRKNNKRNRKRKLNKL